MHRRAVWSQQRNTLWRSKMEVAEDRSRPPTHVRFSTQPATSARISNRNTTAFRISSNPNKTKRITISNRNITPGVAIRVVINTAETSRHAIAVAPNTILIGACVIRKHAYLPENKGLRQILIVNFRATLHTAPANPAAPFWRLTAGHSFSQTISGRTPSRAAHALIESSAKSMICCEEPSYD
jgi:hypothetical protein